MSLEACIPVIYNVHVPVEVVDHEAVAVRNIILHRAQTLYVDHAYHKAVVWLQLNLHLSQLCHLEIHSHLSYPGSLEPDHVLPITWK